MIGKLTMAFWTGQSWHIIKSWYRAGDQKKDIGTVSQVDLTEFSFACDAGWSSRRPPFHLVSTLFGTVLWKFACSVSVLRIVQFLISMLWFFATTIAILCTLASFVASYKFLFLLSFTFFFKSTFGSDPTEWICLGTTFDIFGMT